MKYVKNKTSYNINKKHATKIFLYNISATASGGL